jgi:hypothetical protein
LRQRTDLCKSAVDVLWLQVGKGVGTSTNNNHGLFPSSTTGILQLLLAVPSREHSLLLVSPSGQIEMFFVQGIAFLAWLQRFLKLF